MPVLGDLLPASACAEEVFSSFNESLSIGTGDLDIFLLYIGSALLPEVALRRGDLIMMEEATPVRVGVGSVALFST